LKPTILIAWFLVSLMNGVLHYAGPYSWTECREREDLAKRLGASYAYCTEFER